MNFANKISLNKQISATIIEESAKLSQSQLPTNNPNPQTVLNQMVKQILRVRLRMYLVIQNWRCRSPTKNLNIVNVEIENKSTEREGEWERERERVWEGDWQWEGDWKSESDERVRLSAREGDWEN